MSVYKIVNELEDLLNSSFSVPFANRLLVNEEEFGQLIDALRESLPNEIMEANRIISERQRIIDNAQKEAETIVTQAQTYVSKLTADNAITQQAQEQADKIVADAKEQAKVFEEQAINYGQDVFDYLEASLDKITQAVRDGREQMKSR